jgi:hypothetical protein
MNTRDLHLRKLIAIVIVSSLILIAACKQNDSEFISVSSSLMSTIPSTNSISSRVSSFSSDSSSKLQESTIQSTHESLLISFEESSDSSAISYSSSSASSESYVKPLPSDVELEQKGSILQISETPNIDKLNSFGAEWDPHFWMPYNTKYDIDESDWVIITDRVLELGIDRVRVMWLPMWHEKSNDNKDPLVPDMEKFSFDSLNEEFVSLQRQLDFCQENGIKVTIAYWGPTRQSWIGSRYTGNWWNAPYNDDEYAENISVLLKHLVVTCKYTVVDEFCSFNEPSLGYFNKDGEIEFSEYSNMMNILDTRLKNDGIRDKVRLIASDDSSWRGNIGSGILNGLPWFEKNVKYLNAIGDVFSTHSYRFLLEDSNEDMVFDMKAYFDLLKSYAPDKPLMIHEFGTANIRDAYHATDIETYERALLLPKFAINLLNAGGAGALYWTLYDQLYYEGLEENAKMSFGLWGFKTEDWRIRKTYHSWGLITKHTSPGSCVYAGQSTDPDICIAALEDQEGFATYLIVNTSKTTKEFTINTPVTELAYFDQYVFDKIKAISTSDELTGPDKRIPCSRNVIVGEIGAESFIVLREA